MFHAETKITDELYFPARAVPVPTRLTRTALLEHLLHRHGCVLSGTPTRRDLERLHAQSHNGGRALRHADNDFTVTP